MLKINENNITKIAQLKDTAFNLCIDWVTKNLYWIEFKKVKHLDIIIKLNLMWENWIVK